MHGDDSSLLRRAPRVLELAGDAGTRGRLHGSSFAADIREYAEERVRLSYDGTWAGQKGDRTTVLELAEACLPHHQAYAPDLYEEMLGMAEAAGLSPAEMVVVGGFTDFVDVVRARLGSAPFEDTCTAFVVSDTVADGAGFLGQTWDMHATAERYVVMLRILPDVGPGALVFSTVGCVGQIGMSEAGIAIGINDLSARDGRPGVTWPFVVRKALQQDSLDEALASILGADLAGAHNYLLFDREGSGYDVEAMTSGSHVTPLEEDVLVHTNHCLAFQTLPLQAARPAELQASSEARLARAGELLKDRPVTVDALMALTRDEDAICRRSHPPYQVATCGAAIMRPKTADFWAVWGLPSDHRFEHFTL
ncbi:MAG TPA: C45 family peptidase [Acidimicrobiia bacterium]